MSTLLVRNDSSDELYAATYSLIEPLCVLIVGGLSLNLAVADVLAIVHGTPNAALSGSIYLWGLVLLARYNQALMALPLRLLGAPTTIVDRLKTHPLWSLLALGLLVAARLPNVDTLIPPSSAPLPDMVAASAAAGATAFALSSGARALIERCATLLKTLSASIRRDAANRRRYRACGGQLHLCGGIALGAFRARNVLVGAPNKGDVLLYGEQSARRGTFVVGAPGSSKTRSKIYPDLYWALKSSPRAGALVFITKRRATEDCLAIAKGLRRGDKIHVIGVGADRAHIDITAGMTHESIGDAIQDGLGAANSDFWRHAPASFAEAFFEVAMALAPATVNVPAELDEDGNITPGGEAYSFEMTPTLPTLLRLISLDARRLDAVFSYGFQRADALERTDRARASALRELLHEIKERMVPLVSRDAKLAEELRQSVLPQLQPFARGPLREAFCDPKGLDLALLERGHVLLIEIDETEHPRAVATVVRMLFRRLVQMARERTAADRVGAIDPIFLLCDEYTNYAAPGHVQAWNTVRESNFCATVGVTSISALTKQLGGDREAASAIVANFANKFFFEVDDKATRDLARELIGQSIIARRSESKSTSRSHGSSSAPLASGSSNSSRTSSQSESTSEHLEDSLNGGIWRRLGATRDHATAIAFVRTDQGVQTDLVTLGVLDPAEGIMTAHPEAYGL